MDLVVSNLRIASLDASIATPYGELDADAIAFEGGRIAWIGRASGAPTARATRDGGGRWATPGLIDCHTHLVHGGHRAREFELRLAGASYEEIARGGGGIQSTVAATRAASEEKLVAQALPRLQALAREGVTTVEIKSGYGLDLEGEMKMLRAARRLGELVPVTVRTTLLALHALPKDYAGRADAYVDYACAELLPAAARAGLADAVDAFCDNVGFTPAQTERLFRAAKAHGLPVKLHAEQLSNQHGAALAAEYGALSCDHLEHLDAGGVAAMKHSGSVAMLLPGAFYFLRETKLPPIAELRAAGVPIAIATDHNPGSSPALSLLLMINMACTLFRLTPEEAFAGVTVHAARALGSSDRGRLAPGLRADLAIWDVEHPRELAYRFGVNRCRQRIFEGTA